jgi:hypothetical protein
VKLQKGHTVTNIMNGITGHVEQILGMHAAQQVRKHVHIPQNQLVKLMLKIQPDVLMKEIVGNQIQPHNNLK